MIVIQVAENEKALEMHISLDGQNFAQGMFPPAMNPETHVRRLVYSSQFPFLMLV